jgi:hypothetical protein
VLRCIAAHTISDLHNAITAAIHTITASDCLAHFAHCGDTLHLEGNMLLKPRPPEHAIHSVVAHVSPGDDAF